jgi:hypothetical protein
MVEAIEDQGFKSHDTTEPEKTFLPISYPGSWKEFRDGANWQDIQNFLTMRLISLRNEMESLDGEHVPERLANLQGRAAGLRECLLLPATMEDIHALIGAEIEADNDH